jgi:hypothetical protein
MKYDTDTFDGDARLERFTTYATEVRLKRERDRLEARTAALDARIALIESMPKEPLPTEGDSNPVVHWTKNFGNPNGKTYSYAAIRSNEGEGRWFITGRTASSGDRNSPRGVTWDELVLFAVDRETEAPVFMVATTWHYLD